MEKIINGTRCKTVDTEYDRMIADLGTRVLAISRETKTINDQQGDLQGMGMKQILSSRRVYIALKRPFQNGLFKHALLDGETAQIPASLLRRCPDVTYCGTAEVMHGITD